MATASDADKERVGPLARRRPKLMPSLACGRLRILACVVLAGVSLAACALLARRFSDTSWPLAHASAGLVGGAFAFYFASYVLRALGWRKLFPLESRPERARCLVACGAAAATGVVLPFRLDYAVKVWTLRATRGAKLGLEAIVLSIVSLGLVDAVAVLPLSISATAASSSVLRVPLILVVLFGIGACALLVASRHILRLPPLARRARLSGLIARLATGPRGSIGDAVFAWALLLGCWSARAAGSTLLLGALGVGFSPTLALVVLCISAAAALIPIASGGALTNVGATAATLVVLGVRGSEAVSFGLASGMLLCATAVAAAAAGIGAAAVGRLRARVALG